MGINTFFNTLVRHSKLSNYSNYSQRPSELTKFHHHNYSKRVRVPALKFVIEYIFLCTFNFLRRSFILLGPVTKMSSPYLLRLWAIGDAFGSQDWETSNSVPASEPCSQIAISRNGCKTEGSRISMAICWMSCPFSGKGLAISRVWAALDYLP